MAKEENKQITPLITMDEENSTQTQEYQELSDIDEIMLDLKYKSVFFYNILSIYNKYIIKFESKSFLQKQVRSMVGCLKYVGEQKWKPEKIKEIIRLKKRELCAPPAPASGLYLKKVFY